MPFHGTKVTFAKVLSRVNLAVLERRQILSEALIITKTLAIATKES